MSTRAQRTAQQTTELIKPVAEGMGLELVQVLYLHEQGSWILRILVDRPGSSKGQGVTIADCTQLSRELSDVLDVEDLIAERYRLEVSSPGLDRPLVKAKDFQRFSGQEAKIKTKEVVAGRKTFRGILQGLEDDQVVMDIDGERMLIRHSLIEKANLVPDL